MTSEVGEQSSQKDFIFDRIFIVMSPSLEVHRRMGEVVYNFHNREVDRLADSEKLSEKLFDKLVKNWNVEGLCYYILHRMLDHLEEVVTDKLTSFCEAYVEYGISAERAYETLSKDAFRELSEISFEKTGNEKKDEVVELFKEFTLATLQLGWENVLASIILDKSGDELLLVKKVANRVRRNKKVRKSMDKVWEFLESFCIITSEKVENLEKEKKKRTKELKKKYDKIVPKIRDALKELGIKNLKV